MATRELRSVDAHSQGLTSVLHRDGRLVTGADDRTMAVWDAWRLELVTRSKAHDFLVNFLFWEEDTGTLWSSSSDGSIKAWTWPDLVASEVLHAGSQSKAAFWLDRNRGLALVGTWGGGWHEVKYDGEWRVTRTIETNSFGIYSMVARPQVGVVLVVGTDPTNLWLYDVETGDVWPLPVPDLPLYWTVAAGDDRIIVVGRNTALSYRFRRVDGALNYEISAGLNSDLGELYVGTAIPGSSLVACGSGAGRVVVFDTYQLPIVPLSEGRLGK
jgi:WD40 repeat protein